MSAAEFDPALVEKAAQAIYERGHEQVLEDSDGAAHWDTRAKGTQEHYRKVARAALTAATTWMNDCDAEALRRNAMHARLVREAKAEGWDAGVRQQYAAKAFVTFNPYRKDGES